MSLPHLVVRNLVKTYPGQTTPAIRNASFALNKGEMMALLGPSGCGKTTILRTIAGLESSDSGSITLGGREIASIPVHQRNIGMVFQNYALFPHQTVAENVSFGLEMRGVGRAERERRVQEALDLVQLSDKGGRRISQLSGGQQQRAALARSLVINPDILLLDEPLSNLDANLRDDLRKQIRDVQLRTGVTAIFVTHDQAEALAMADRIAVINAGQIEQIGTPKSIYDAPQTDFVARFIGEGSFLTGMVAAGAEGQKVARVAGLGDLPYAGNSAVNETLSLLLRPHRLRLVPLDDVRNKEGHFTGHITESTYQGEVVTLAVRVGAHVLEVRIPTLQALPSSTVGAEIGVIIDADSLTQIPAQVEK